MLELVGLSLDLQTDRGWVPFLEDVSLRIERGETLGVVGESGAGKTMLIRAVMGLLSPRSTRLSGRVLLNGRDIAGLPRRELRRLWGREVGMIFQDPMTSLNPVRTVGAQLVESIQRHQHLSSGAARSAAVEMLQSVQISSPSRRLGQYPHELSGGMRQRICVAIALAGRPALLLADEPTTALDVTVQAEILELLAQLQREQAMAMMFVTHNLAVVAKQADSIAVMYSGRVVEILPADKLLSAARMPYTRALLQSAPRLDSPSHARLATVPGQPPDFFAPPDGCRFAPRCPIVQQDCLEREPPLARAEQAHFFRCWHPVETPLPLSSGDLASAEASSTSGGEVTSPRGRYG